MTELHRSTDDATGDPITAGYVPLADGSGDVDWGPGGTADAELNIEGGQSVIKPHGSMGSTETFDPTDGNVHTGTLDADLTVTLSAPTGSGAAVLELWLTQDGTGGWDITWPGSVTTDGTFTPDTTAGVTVRYILETIDGGTSWLLNLVGGSGSPLTIQDEGTPLATAADTLNFVGAGVTATGTGGIKTITISGSGSNIFVVDPGTPTYDDTDPAEVVVTLVALFGIDGGGDPYYNGAGVTSGDEAALMRDPDTGSYFLRSYGF